MVLAEVVEVVFVFALVFWINLLPSTFACVGKDTFETVLAGVVLVDVTDVAVEEVDDLKGVVEICSS